MALDDFWEVGASGRRYSRTDVLDELERRYSVRHADVWESSEFHRRRLAPDVYLLTYTLILDTMRRTCRSIIWQRTGEGWKIVYHHGTIIQAEYR